MSSRREFLKTAAAGGAGLSLSGITPTLAQGAAPAKSDVVVGKGKAAVIIPKIIARMGGMAHFVKPGARVMIKPNMSFANPPEWATTTSPEAVYTVAKMCLNAGASSVVICDNTLRDPETCKRKTGIADAVKGLKKVTIFTPQSSQAALFETRISSAAKLLTKTDVMRELSHINALICLPIAKSHAAGQVSLGIKGLMGLIKDRHTMHRDMDLHEAIAEQLYYIRPTLTIIDGSRALLDNGPGGPGKVAELNTFCASTDPVAADSWGTTLAPWFGRKCEGREVKHLAHAARLGFGNVESALITEISV